MLCYAYALALCHAGAPHYYRCARAAMLNRVWPREIRRRPRARSPRGARPSRRTALEAHGPRGARPSRRTALEAHGSSPGGPRPCPALGSPRHGPAPPWRWHASPARPVASPAGARRGRRPCSAGALPPAVGGPRARARPAPRAGGPPVRRASRGATCGACGAGLQRGQALPYKLRSGALARACPTFSRPPAP